MLNVEINKWREVIEWVIWSFCPSYSHLHLTFWAQKYFVYVEDLKYVEKSNTWFMLICLNSCLMLKQNKWREVGWRDWINNLIILSILWSFACHLLSAKGFYVCQRNLMTCNVESNLGNAWLFAYDIHVGIRPEWCSISQLLRC